MNSESEKRIEIARKLCEILKKEVKENLLSFVVFGSTARGKAKTHSDIDVLIICKDKRETWKHYLKAKLEIQKSHPPMFSSIITTETNLRENPYILLDLIDDNILFYDPKNVFRKLIEDLRKKLKELGAKRIWIDEDTWYWDLKPDWKPGEVVEIKL